MLSPNELKKEDLKRAFDYLNTKGTEAIKIVANPVFEDVLFEAGVGIPIEFNETEIGVEFIGSSGETVKIRVCNDDLLTNFKEAVCGKTGEVTDGYMIRVWKWEHAPLCLKQLADFGGDKEWIILVPPTLLWTNLNWFKRTVLENSADYFLLPCGWQVYTSAQ